MNHIQQTLNRLDRLIGSRSILQHPFYKAWQCGALSLDQLAVYAGIYYPHVAAFPGYLQSAIEHADDPRVQKELADNLADELHNPAPHPELWLDFAEALGCDREATARTNPHPAAEQMVRTFRQFTAANSGQALTALYAYESQQPEVARQKATGLKKFYGVQNSRALAYFEVHAEADILHRNGERQALAYCLEAGISPADIFQTANSTLDAYWNLLDGVCNSAGIELIEKSA